MDQGKLSGAQQQWHCTTNIWVELTAMTNCVSTTMYTSSGDNFTSTSFGFISRLVLAMPTFSYYTNACPKNYKEFRLTLAKELIGDYYSRKHPGRGLATPHTLPIRHFPVKEKKNRCWYCAHVRHPSRRRETRWFCHDCQVYLCHTGLTDGSDCFLLHHK